MKKAAIFLILILFSIASFSQQIIELKKKDGTRKVKIKENQKVRLEICTNKNIDIVIKGEIQKITKDTLYFSEKIIKDTLLVHEKVRRKETIYNYEKKLKDTNYYSIPITCIRKVYKKTGKQIAKAVGVPLLGCAVIVLIAESKYLIGIRSLMIIPMTSSGYFLFSIPFEEEFEIDSKYNIETKETNY